MTGLLKENTDGKKKRITRIKAFYIVALSIIATLLLSLIFLQVATLMGIFPDTNVLYSGEDIHSRHLSQLEKEGIIDEKDEISLFISGGLFSVTEDGNLITPDKFITYQKEGGELKIFPVLLSDIEDVQMNLEDETHPGFSMLIIKAKNNQTFGIPVPKEDEADKKFYQALIEAWKEKIELKKPVLQIEGDVEEIP